MPQNELIERVTEAILERRYSRRTRWTSIEQAAARADAQAALKAHEEWLAEKEISDDAARQMLRYFNIYDDGTHRHTAKQAFRAALKINSAALAEE